MQLDCVNRLVEQSLDLYDACHQPTTSPNNLGGKNRGLPPHLEPNFSPWLLQRRVYNNPEITTFNNRFRR